MTLGAIRQVGIVVVLALAVVPAGVRGQVSSRTLLQCQRTISLGAQSIARTVARVSTCTEAIVRCNLASEIDAVDPTDCLNKASERRCSPLPARLTSTLTRARQRVLRPCMDLELATVNRFIQGLGFVNVSASCGSVTGVADLIDCLIDAIKCGTERELFIADPRAQDSLQAAGIDSAYPCVAAAAP